MSFSARLNEIFSGFNSSVTAAADSDEGVTERSSTFPSSIVEGGRPLAEDFNTAFARLTNSRGGVSSDEGNEPATTQGTRFTSLEDRREALQSFLSSRGVADTSSSDETEAGPTFDIRSASRDAFLQSVASRRESLGAVANQDAVGQPESEGGVAATRSAAFIESTNDRVADLTAFLNENSARFAESPGEGNPATSASEGEDASAPSFYDRLDQRTAFINDFISSRSVQVPNAVTDEPSNQAPGTATSKSAPVDPLADVKARATNGYNHFRTQEAQDASREYQVDWLKRAGVVDDNGANELNYIMSTTFAGSDFGPTSADSRSSGKDWATMNQDVMGVLSVLQGLHQERRFEDGYKMRQLTAEENENLEGYVKSLAEPAMERMVVEARKISGGQDIVDFRQPELEGAREELRTYLSNRDEFKERAAALSERAVAIQSRLADLPEGMVSNNLQSFRLGGVDEVQEKMGGYVFGRSAETDESEFAEAEASLDQIERNIGFAELFASRTLERTSGDTDAGSSDATPSTSAGSSTGEQVGSEGAIVNSAPVVELTPQERFELSRTRMSDETSQMREKVAEQLLQNRMPQLFQ